MEKEAGGGGRGGEEENLDYGEEGRRKRRRSDVGEEDCVRALQCCTSSFEISKLEIWLLDNCLYNNHNSLFNI